MRQTGFWANVGLLVASVLVLLTWGVLPLFTTDQTAVIQKLYHPPTTSSAKTPPASMMLYGSTILSNLDTIDQYKTSNQMLFSLGWMLIGAALLGGAVSGGVALWRPEWMTQAAFAGVVCGVVVLVCAGFLRFQYANMTSTGVFDSTALGWWALLIGSGAMIGQGVWARPRPALMIPVPQPPPFSQASRSNTHVPAVIDVRQGGAIHNGREAAPVSSSTEERQKSYTYSPNAPTASQPLPAVSAPVYRSALPPAPRLRFVHLGTNQQYSLDFSQVISIGRSKQNHIVLPDQQVSRHHAVLRWQGEWVMIANQSQNAPLFINQQPIRGEQPLRLGDTVTLGQTTLRLIREE